MTQLTFQWHHTVNPYRAELIPVPFEAAPKDTNTHIVFARKDGMYTNKNEGNASAFQKTVAQQLLSIMFGEQPVIDKVTFAGNHIYLITTYFQWSNEWIQREAEEALKQMRELLFVFIPAPPISSTNTKVGLQ